MKWTKKDIGIMCGAISSFWLYNRPLSGSQAEAAEQVRAHLREHRVQIVLSGISDLVNHAEHRRIENLNTAKHYETHPHVLGNATQEIVDRFMGLSSQDERDVSKGLKLLDRIRENGLPSEVVSFDPTTVRRY